MHQLLLPKVKVIYIKMVGGQPGRRAPGQEASPGHLNSFEVLANQL